MAPLWSSQPFKTIYTAGFLLYTVPHLLFLFAQYLVKPLRPCPEWSAAVNLTSAIVRKFFWYITATRSQRTFCAEPEEAGERCSRVDPPASYFFAGALAASEAVKPGPVDAVWFPTPPPSRGDVAELKKQKIVLHFPGGAFVMALGHNNKGHGTADLMAKGMRATRTVWAQYRLAGTPETCFPAPIQDAVTFYHYVVSLGVDPKNIILSGDSAGGNVVIALLRYLEDLRARTRTPEQLLPLPGGALVLSPWVHVAADAGKHYDESSHSQSDFLLGSFLQWGVDSYLPKEELSSEAKAYISPLHRPFKLPVPLYVHDGAAEGFHADIKSFVDEMVELNGDRVRFRSTALAPHDLLVSHQAWGMTGEVDAMLEEACGFFEEAE
ncbi:alpha/beta hydrolase fold-3 domain-containing protein [Durotheca rogersii]|uniref:alpha/beta hydrolase fold-3 domain-containing protein n=1 Tax=Durotheca rogersii TaxID=419775 RepID=UPI0022211222|nr:alpha/beta hydrolase fold-3 domain-containing protein [Durotheca rogersii]KAI5866563.1 alpha/beta hydrolase fold-3 domain-containing protein [Durotheca rogersii]